MAQAVEFSGFTLGSNFAIVCASCQKITGRRNKPPTPEQLVCERCSRPVTVSEVGQNMPPLPVRSLSGKTAYPPFAVYAIQTDENTSLEEKAVEIYHLLRNGCFKDHLPSHPIIHWIADVETGPGGVVKTNNYWGEGKNNFNLQINLFEQTIRNPVKLLAVLAKCMCQAAGFVEVLRRIPLRLKEEIRASLQDLEEAGETEAANVLRTWTSPDGLELNRLYDEVEKFLGDKVKISRRGITHPWLSHMKTCRECDTHTPVYRGGNAMSFCPVCRKVTHNTFSALPPKGPIANALLRDEEKVKRLGIAFNRRACRKCGQFLGKPDINCPNCSSQDTALVTLKRERSPSVEIMDAPPNKRTQATPW